jgi:hypothetical protein
MNDYEIQQALAVIIEEIEGKEMTVRELMEYAFKAGWELGYEAHHNEDDEDNPGKLQPMIHYRGEQEKCPDKPQHDIEARA